MLGRVDTNLAAQEQPLHLTKQLHAHGLKTVGVFYIATSNQCNGAVPIATKTATKTTTKTTTPLQNTNQER